MLCPMPQFIYRMRDFPKKNKKYTAYIWMKPTFLSNSHQFDVYSDSVYATIIICSDEHEYHSGLD